LSGLIIFAISFPFFLMVVRGDRRDVYEEQRWFNVTLATMRILYSLKDEFAKPMPTLR
jgi:hypothetical protein